MTVGRRDFMKLSAIAGAGALSPAWARKALAVALAPGLSDPALQPKFEYPVPNALDPSFRYQPDKKGRYKVRIRQGRQKTGLVDSAGNLLDTTIWGYGDGRGPTWPGRTFEVQSAGSGGFQETEVQWKNQLEATSHLLPVDTSLHWAYSLSGYEQYSIASHGVPIVTHLHGGHSDFQFDGNPEFFYSPDLGLGQVVGPQWAHVDGGFTNKFRYDNDVPAGTLWYHDHALGITRLNVYAGMGGFFFVRDALDTGEPDNPLGLPAFPHEMALAIQDRMFRASGELFYPAFPGDPFWEDFITGEGLEDDEVPQPSALAEFFGDHMVVNGVIWPKTNVEPRNYRLRLLNGTDSRFLVLRFRVASSPTTTTLDGASAPRPFYVIGSDQGLAASATQTDTLVFEPGGRYDVVFDFSQVPAGSRVIMENIGGDAPFGGDFGDALAPEDFFPDRQTDRIMAFDVVLPDSGVPDAFDPAAIGGYGGNTQMVTRTRKVALFEGKDEYGRLQPLLGTAAPEVDASGQTVNGSIAWHSPTTENPGLDTTEIWEIYNATGDAHPVHLHLVNFEVLDRASFTADAVEQPVLQHNGTYGVGFRLENIVVGGTIEPGAGYVENAPKDMVTALPEQVTRIKVTFDKPGRYVWHCHILSHEDHEMMRVLHVGTGA
ncbi:MAG: multicopper oxidase domain-containing protein [Deltaproteobacteria bacterium]|nr:multicopper oxidase domain-containing protein [Deltaproteobacteria bacterium]